MLAIALFALSGTAAFASTWNAGDIFVGVASGKYKVYSNSGTFKETINAGTRYTAGCAFNNAQSKLFTTYVSNGNVETFATAHAHTFALFAGGIITPEAVVFDKSGNVFVSTGSSGSGIREYNSSGALINTILPFTRIDWIDLAADQKTMFYTDEGSTIHRVDVSTPGGTALPDFASSGSTLYALRILPDGGLLAANSGNIQRYNAAGVIIQSYDLVGEDNWFALNLDPNGTSFWSADFGTSDVVKFNIASGVKENSFNTGTGFNTVLGLCLKREITVGGGGDTGGGDTGGGDTGGIGDTTPPTCVIKHVVKGPPKKLIIKTQDRGSGLKTIVVNITKNANTIVPPFTLGRRRRLMVTSAKINQSQNSVVKLTVTDMAGNVTVCDPVLSSVAIRRAGQPSKQTYTHLARSESKVRLINSKPGIRTVALRVNGHALKQIRLASGQTRIVNVARWMRRGNNNKITVIARGAVGTSATILISD
ncbi:MAG: hypothetical protein M3T56_06295 [Chloroflexota bacterium]|nr:hypothetical protein [Chloroflexota bacterium]